MAEGADREIPDRGREEADRGAGRLGKADGDAEAASRRTEEAPRRRLEDDRLGRHLAVRQFRLQSRRRAHRPGQGPPRQGGQGLGQARIQEPRRHRRTRHAQHQGGAAPPAQMGAAGRGDRTRSARHDQGHGEQGLSRSQAHPGAPQHREGASVLRHRRIDGRAHQALRGVVQRGEDRIQAHGLLLLPQLPVRERVEGQSPPP